MRSLPAMLATLALAAAVPLPARAQTLASLPPLPDSSGYGPHILALGRDQAGGIWVGTYGHGIDVLRPGAVAWEQIRTDSSGRSISFDYVDALAFGPGPDVVWYGTVGNGWGRSRDGGQTWENWDATALGAQYLYVTPNGIVRRGDTVYVATADGIKYTWDLGATWGTVPDTGRRGLPRP